VPEPSVSFSMTGATCPSKNSTLNRPRCSGRGAEPAD
jgi:hypothetical protein